MTYPSASPFQPCEYLEAGSYNKPHADDPSNRRKQTHYRTPSTSYASHHQFPEHSLLHDCLKRDRRTRTTKLPRTHHPAFPGTQKAHHPHCTGHPATVRFLTENRRCYCSPVTSGCPFELTYFPHGSAAQGRRPGYGRQGTALGRSRRKCELTPAEVSVLVEVCRTKRRTGPFGAGCQEASRAHHNRIDGPTEAASAARGG